MQCAFGRDGNHAMRDLLDSLYCMMGLIMSVEGFSAANIEMSR